MIFNRSEMQIIIIRR